jgi:galactonate dehydratase
MRIAAIEALVFNVSEKTNWFFVRVTAENGLTGIGEASLNGYEPAQVAFAENVRQEWIGKTVAELLPLLKVYAHSPGGLIASSIISATEQAVTDLRAKAAGVPVYQLLGGSAVAARKSVRVYANINRGARDRSPEGIARAARHAVEQGYGALKIAPFDGVFWGDSDEPEKLRRTQAGIARVRAIREAVGPDIDIMVDCHWRFDERGAQRLLHELRAVRLYWIECPVSENSDSFALLQRLHAGARASAMKLAGAERQIGLGGFAPFVDDGLLDVVMPDVKYAGGYGEMLRIAARCAERGVHFAPHNPTGPVCNLASMQICAVAPAFLVLEHQLAESPLFYDVAGGYRPKLVNGCFELPDVPGIGVELDDAVLRAHPYRRLPANANLDERLG